MPPASYMTSSQLTHVQYGSPERRDQDAELGGVHSQQRRQALEGTLDLCGETEKGRMRENE